MAPSSSMKLDKNKLHKELFVDGELVALNLHLQNKQHSLKIQENKNDKTFD